MQSPATAPRERGFHRIWPPVMIGVMFVLEVAWILLLVSTPEQKCIGLPEQKYISDAGKKAPEPGAFSSDIRLGSDYLPACPSWHGVSGACSD